VFRMVPVRYGLYLCVPYGSHSKQRLFHQTALTGWALLCRLLHSDLVLADDSVELVQFTIKAECGAYQFEVRQPVLHHVSCRAPVGSTCLAVRQIKLVLIACIHSAQLTQQSDLCTLCRD
jgi:hypothetical protein